MITPVDTATIATTPAPRRRRVLPWLMRGLGLVALLAVLTLQPWALWGSLIIALALALAWAINQ